MKKNFLVTIITMLAAISMVACGQKKNEEPTVEKFTGVKTVEVAYDSTGSKKDVVVAEVEYKDGEAIGVDIDVKLEDGTMKSTLSKNGEYVMKEGEEFAWHQQVDMLEEAIVKNEFDLSKISLTDEDGHTDAVSGVSIKVNPYIEAVEQALKEVKEGNTEYTKVVFEEETTEETSNETSETEIDEVKDDKKEN